MALLGDVRLGHVQLVVTSCAMARSAFSPAASAFVVATAFASFTRLSIRHQIAKAITCEVGDIRCLPSSRLGEGLRTQGVRRKRQDETEWSPRTREP